MPRATCHWHVACVLTSPSWARTDERTCAGQILFGPDGLQKYICDRLQYVLCHMSRAYGTWHVIWRIYSLQSKADPIWTGPTTFHTDKRWERVFVDIWMPTKWHVPNNLMKMPIKPSLVAWSKLGNRRSNHLYERKTIRLVALRFVLRDTDNI